MIFAALNFISAVTISLVAAYFSIIGLSTIFPGSVVAVIVMAGSLELGKLVGSVWLHKNWKEAPKYIRYYLLIAVVILSLITSMGIFGFLSKSHIEHDFSSQQNTSLIIKKGVQIQRLEDQIKVKEETLESFVFVDGKFQEAVNGKVDFLKESLNNIRNDRDVAITRLNEQIKDRKEQLKEIREDRKSIEENNSFNVGSKLKKFDEENDSKIKELNEYITKHEGHVEAINQETKKEIYKITVKIGEVSNPEIKDVNIEEKKELNDDIAKLDKQIETLMDEKFTLEAAQRKIEAEIGPVKYVASLLKDFLNIDVDTESSVRFVIIILIFVFDPLALLLLIGAVMSFEKAREKKLPADELAIRKELLEELEDYISQGGSVKMFLDRYH